MYFDSAYPTHPSDTVTKCTIYPPILLVERLFEWSYFAILSYGYQNLAQKCFCFFIFWDRIFARVRFYKSSFFIASFWHQELNSYYLAVVAAKIPKISKRTSFLVGPFFLTFLTKYLFLNNCSVICIVTWCYVLYQTHSELWHIQKSVNPDKCKHIQGYSALLSHIHAYWGIINAYSGLFRYIQQAPCVTLA